MVDLAGRPEVSISRLEHAPGDEDVERQCRAIFANMLAGARQSQLDRAACQKRLADSLAALPARGSTWNLFLLRLKQTMTALGESGHYLREPVPPRFLDVPAVSFQEGTDFALEAWVGGSLAPRLLAHKVNNDEVLPDAKLAAPGRPMWLTPFVDAAKTIVDRACLRPGPDLAAEARNLMGASHWVTGSPIFAFITDAAMGQLSFDRINESLATTVLTPVGPTSIEARLGRHFRHWPLEGATDDGCGRTYDLDSVARSRADPVGSHGAVEIVRSGLPVREATCVYIGSLDAASCAVSGPDEIYLRDIKADRSAWNLLVDVHAEFGL